MPIFAPRSLRCKGQFPPRFGALFAHVAPRATHGVALPLGCRRHRRTREIHIMHSIARAALVALAFTTAIAAEAQVRSGIQLPGTPGVTLTTADIMAQQAAAPAVSTAVGE